MTEAAALRRLRSGIFRRRIRVAAVPGGVRADLEDDVHRYGVFLAHDGGRVTRVEGIPIRVPWSRCGEAAQVLSRLAGMSLSRDPLAVYRYANGKLQCTHMFELAGLAVTHAARGLALREYEIEAPCLDPAGPRSLALHRDGKPVLSWTVEGTTLLAPEPFAGRDVRQLIPWAAHAFDDPDDFEAIVLLRRALMISGSRWHDLDVYPHARATGHGLGACYVFRDEVAPSAVRMVGSTRDFTDTPERLLADIGENAHPPDAGTLKRG